MRVLCKVLDAPTNAVATHRAGKGSVSLGTVKEPGLKRSVPCLTVFTATGKEHPYHLDGRCEVQIIHAKFVTEGKLTIVWSKPNRTTMISEARPDVLRNFMNQFNDTRRGENHENLKEIAKERKSDFGGQVELVVRNKNDYPSTFPSATLKTLVLSGLRLRRVDGRWFSCTLLTSLDLSRNQMSTAPDLPKLRLLSRLVHLQVLNLSNNGFETVSSDLMSSLPPSLLSLDLSSNRLRCLPSLRSVPALLSLNVANNQLQTLTSELRSRCSMSLNVDNNQLRWLPCLRSSTRPIFSAAGNPLDQPRRSPKTRVIKVPSLLQCAMECIQRNRVVVDAVIEARFWDEDEIDFCDQCRRMFAADRLYPFITRLEARQLSVQAQFAARYPSRLMTCRRCRRDWMELAPAPLRLQRVQRPQMRIHQQFHQQQNLHDQLQLAQLRQLQPRQQINRQRQARP
ncbi:hypothetical protein PFISCL1PPCAC_8070 [Pristionchus fissidentatus]|uniref:PIF1/LRR1 pleckstrin homology domain-containing protein n=1 Tax=Pristionchus fissidentatus TaxID=1538716 RepID=A0AAV5VBY8_9BILA|nr:hypothetical protein PFISCL1PPCAC_8070 [Pristionchus fissidentatus]